MVAGVFTFDQLKSFVVVAEELHFGRAAELLNMTQPPLSRQIQKLEAELEFSLFDRRKKTVSLTAAGRVFYDEARKILQIADSSRAMARKIADGSAGEIRIGFTATGILALLGDILQRFDARAPEIRVDVREMVSHEQVSAVQRGAVDIGFVREVPALPELRSLVVRREPLIAAIGSRHPLAVTSRNLRIAELENERILTYSPVEARYFRALVDNVLSAVSTTSSQQITQVHSMLALVAANKGIALVPRSAASLGMSGVVFRPLAEHLAPVVQLHAVWRNDNSNPVFRTAHTVLEELNAAVPR